MRARRIILLVILALYVILGMLYAVRTPAWQAPDEPAHYNYARFIATTGSFPVLQMGDYPHGYMEEIKGRKFPPDLSIDPIRYEFHQPPLYYILLAPIYAVVRGALLPLRLASVLLGLGVVLLAYAIARRIYPERSALALGTATFVAFLPQHLATVSQVGNDVLAELLFAAVLYILVSWVLEEGARDQGSGIRRQEARGSRWSALTLGLLLGLILITKTTAYIAVPLVGGVLVWRWWRERASMRRVVADALLIGLPALLLALPWYARDVAIYGWPDFLGLTRHDQIVVGQTRTGEFLAQVGWNAYISRALEFTFKSFWGVFGWLGVFMDSRVYFLVALLSGIAAGGLLLRMANRKWQIASTGSEWPPRVANGESSLVTRHSSLILLAISALLTFLTYAWYNTQFVQHQGRYLFTALIPIALAFALGWEAALWPRAGRILAAVLIGFALALAAWGVLSHTGLPKWPMMITAVLAAGLFLASWLPRKLQPVLFALPYALFVLLDLYALFKAIGPQLAR
jgi:4-amino-4-deoxy-L-arabinose transferase-like glycosyltransferase